MFIDLSRVKNNLIYRKMADMFPVSAAFIFVSSLGAVNCIAHIALSSLCLSALHLEMFWIHMG